MIVSVVIACRNAAGSIERAIRSVLAQDDPNWELIVIDGASTDGTLEILERYRERIAHLVSEQDAGVYDAQNKGARLAAGDYLYFLNADDELFDASVLGRVRRFLLDRPVDYVYGNTLISGPGERAPRIRRHDRVDRMFLFFECVNTQSSFIRRDAFERLGRYDTAFKLAADYALLLKVFHDSRTTTAHLDATIARYSLNGMSADIRNRRRFVAERMAFQKRHFSPLACRVFNFRPIRFPLTILRPLRRCVARLIGWNRL